MEALFFDKKNLKLIYKTDCEIPNLEKDTDVLVKVEYAGVCGTDVHIIQGEFPCNEEAPFIMGHEFVGVVAQAGASSNFKPGQRVVIDPSRGCNKCNTCHIGNYHLCKAGGLNNFIGITKNGGWAQYSLVPDTQILLLPDTITADRGALTEPLSVVAHAWDRTGKIYVREDVLVMGAGIIGLLLLQTLHLQGHRNVTVAELHQGRLNLVKKLGSNYAAMTPEEIQKSSKRFDVIFDCTGVARAMESSVSLLNSGGRYILLGCCNPKDYAKLNPFEIFQKELSIIAVALSPFSFPNSIGFLEAMGTNYIDYEKLGIEMFPLSKYEEALEKLKKGVISKAVFKM